MSATPRREYLKHRASGLTRSEAAEAAGVTVYRVHRWCEDPRFAAREAAAADSGIDAIKKHVRTIMREQQHADPAVSLRAADVLLKAEAASRPQRLEVSGPDGNPIRVRSGSDEALMLATQQWLSQVRGALTGSHPSAPAALPVADPASGED